MVMEQIREHLDPTFRPFAIRLSDGRRFEVPHRDFIAVATRLIVVIDEREISHAISPLHIVSIEDPLAAK